MSKLKLLDLFSGIGGFSLGLESTGGFETIAFVEKDKFCQKVLAKNFNNITIEGEIRNVKGEKYKADIITAGFPCQPFSVAGKRKGKDDDRYLWDETIRVIRECKPRWFVGENVEGIVNIANGTVLQQIQQDLEKEGFEVQCGIIPASGIGAWHQRKRVWIIAHSNSNRDRIKITGSNGEEKEIQREHREKDSTSWKFIRTNTNDVPNTKSKGSFSSGRSNTSDNEQQRLDINKERNRNKIRSKSSRCSEQTISNTNTWNVEAGRKRQWGVCSKEKGQWKSNLATNICETLSNTNSQRTQIQTERKHTSIKMSGSSSKESWWETQSKLCGIPHGISYELDKDRTNRIKALGNSIVPLIAYEIGKAIISAEDQSD